MSSILYAVEHKLFQSYLEIRINTAKHMAELIKKGKLIYGVQGDIWPFVVLNDINDLINVSPQMIP